MLTYEEIVRDVKAGKYVPIYFLMGEEDYYIDRIADYIVSQALTEEEREFNLTVFFGLDVDIATVINAAKRYPMMSERQVVVVKEAQNIKSIDSLSYYLKKPLLSTVLVFCYKHGVLDRRKKLAADIDKLGVLFESKRLRDSQLPGFISSYLKRKKVDIDQKAMEMMIDFVGSDLNRMAGELDKLVIAIGSRQRRITAELIERNIGISKDYNNFELRSALIERNVLKANRIVKYFADNPRQNPLVLTLSVLFSFFSNLIQAYYAPDKSERGVAGYLGFRSSWQAKEYISAMSRYPAQKVFEIIGAIRETDARSKGIGNSSTPDGELLRELVFFILH